MTTARASTLVPSPKQTVCTEPRCSSASTLRATIISAPRRRACCAARVDNDAPLKPAREAEVVLDPCALGSLAAGRVTLDHRGPQALRRAVDGGGQPGRTGTDDDEVVQLRFGRCLQPERVGQFERLGPVQRTSRRAAGRAVARRRPRTARAGETPRGRARARATGRGRGCGRGTCASRSCAPTTGCRRHAHLRSESCSPPPTTGAARR